MMGLLHIRDRKIVEVAESCFQIIWYEITVPVHILTLTRPKDINKINLLEFFLRLMIVVPDHTKTQESCNEAVEEDPSLLACAPDRLKSQEMCSKAVRNKPYTLRFIPDHLKTREMCNYIMHINLAAFFLIPDRVKAQEMCIKAVEKDPWQLYCVPDHLKTKEMCDEAVRDHSFSLQYVPNWFVTQQQVKIWHDDSEYYYDDNDDDDDDDDDRFTKCMMVIKNVRPRKHKLKKELMRIAWHLSRWWDWDMSEDEKNRQKSCGSNR